MEIAKLRVSGTDVKIVSQWLVPAGLIGGYVTVEYADSVWEDLSKTVVFQGAVTRDVVTNSEIIEIPHEVVADAGERLKVGFYGVRIDGTLAIPTFWADLGLIVKGTDPSGDPSTDPSLPVWAQLAAEIDKSAAAVQYSVQELTEEQQTQARENIGAVSDKLFIITEGSVVNEMTNILDDASILTEGKYCSHISGNISNHTNYYCTEDYIPFPIGARLFVHYSASSAKAGYPTIAYYDENYNYISGESGPDLEQSEYDGKTGAFYTIPENTCYFRFSINRTYTENYFDYLFLYIVTDKTIGGSVEIPGLIIPQSELAGKIIVNFGDSIFGIRRPPEDISTEIAKLTGATVYNCGFGGCQMSNHSVSTYSAFSMCNLADAIVSGNWSAQETAVADASSNAVPSYFSEALNILKNLDFGNVDMITIAYGTNDFTGGDSLDDGSDALSKNTFAGALRYSIETLLTAYPGLRIFLCSPTYRFWMDGSNNFTEDSDTHTVNNQKLTDFVEKTKAVAEEYHLPYIDNYYGVGFNKFNRTVYFSETDGTHPLTSGCHRIAAHMAKELF